MGLLEFHPSSNRPQKLDRIHDALTARRGQQASRHRRAGRPQGQAHLCRRHWFADKDEGKPMALDSLFRIHSMTKPLVSVA
jgi:CubicO group peptidase (beta-lactamase class C family)